MALPDQNPVLDHGPHPEELQLRVDFFRKLGYSPADVEAALQKLHLDTDTNAVLGELVRIGARISHPDNDERSAGFRNSLLPASWTSAPAKSKAGTVQKKSTEDLRPIVIDGSNVAMSHGNKTIFSCRGIQLAVNFFLDRGHDKIKVFVPSWRKEQLRPDAPIRDQHILADLEKRNILVYTPSRHVGGKRVVCYDDRFIVKVASESEGVIISNDTYRDLQGENAEWKKCIEERLLMYSFVDDKFMPPDDPLGRHGPTLDNFLRKKPLQTELSRHLCPYGKKCTYGIKCRFYHPERKNQPYISVADELREKAQISSKEPNHRSSPKSFLLKTDSPTSFQLSKNLTNDLESSQKHMKVSGEHKESERVGQNPLMLSQHYGDGSLEYLDSGLGSYDSLNNSLWSWPQQQGQVSVGSSHNNMSQSSQFDLPESSRQGINTEEPKYSPYAFSVQHKGSFPVHLQYNSAPHVEQRYWSHPALPHVKSSLPVPLQTNSAYSCPLYNPWALAPSFVSNDPRIELRSKLQAIFNPADVDRAMEMFPHLTDSEKLAEEIVKLKTQRGIFS